MIGKNPKIFLCDCSSRELIAAAHEFRKRGAQILYWTGYKALFEEEARDKIAWPNTVFHNILDAVKAFPAPGMDALASPPPEAALIEEMLECESMALTMMSRMDFGNMSLLKKKHLYYKYLGYWDSVLKKFQPDMIVFAEIPHVVYNFVLYSLARKRGIKTIMLATSTIWGWLNLVSDYKKNDERLLKEYLKIENEKHDIDELHPSLKIYFSKLLDGENVTPAFNKEQGRRMKSKSLFLPDFHKILKYWRTGDLVKRAYWHLKSLFFLKKQPLNIDELDGARRGSLWELNKISRIKRGFRKEYLELQTEADLNRKFVYLPLHFQPERSTSPMGGYFADQILMAKIIAAALPEGWRLYIKEYPLQWSQYSYRSHLCRYQGFYKELAEIKNAYLIQTEAPTNKLIDAAQVVATATGTSGMEALVMGKPVLVFGYPWYMYCDGVFRVNGVSECRRALRAIELGYKPSLSKVLNYFIALERTAVRTNQMLRYRTVKDVSFEETVRNMTEALWAELSKQV